MFNSFLDMLCKSIDWFLYVKDLRHERVYVADCEE